MGKRYFTLAVLFMVATLATLVSAQYTGNWNTNPSCGGSEGISGCPTYGWDGISPESLGAAPDPNPSDLPPPDIKRTVWAPFPDSLFGDPGGAGILWLGYTQPFGSVSWPSNRQSWWHSVTSTVATSAIVRWGKLGGPRHRAGVERISRWLKSRGFKVENEKWVPTENGAKSGRYVDVVGTKENQVEMYQVGRENLNGTPVSREVQALDDIEAATGIRPTFAPYNIGDENLGLPIVSSDMPAEGGGATPLEGATPGEGIAPGEGDIVDFDPIP